MNHMGLRSWLIIRILRRASKQIHAMGDAPCAGSFDTCRDLGNYLETCAAEWQMGDRDSLERLWIIFAPTSDWDDARGSQPIGNLAFAVLDQLRRSRSIQ